GLLIVLLIKPFFINIIASNLSYKSFLYAMITLEFYLGMMKMNIGQNIKKFRLAKELKIELKTLRNYEQGVRNPKYEILEIIKTYFNCSYDDLLK
nr:helix-turn-helix domain-containing protein [Acholeplasmatales bacterium]